MSANILLIEDNERNRYLVTFLLEARGYNVMQAADGPSGIEMAAMTCVDLVLLDIQLPGMDGYSVVRSFRSKPEYQKLAIIALTSYAMAGDREKLIAAGCDGYMEKPINPQTFVIEISQFLPNQYGRMK